MAASSVRFVYYQPASILEMQPCTGPVIGGTVVTVYGRGFIESEPGQCRFGHTSVHASVISSTSAECVSPAGSVGNATVEYSNNGADFDSSLAIK